MKKPFGRLLMNVWKSDFKEQPVLVHYLEYKEYYNAVCRGKEYRVPAFQVLLCSVQQGFCYGTEIYKLSNEVGGYSVAAVIEQPVPPFAVPFYIFPCGLQSPAKCIGMEYITSNAAIVASHHLGLR